ncbi:MAG: sigma-70 family RNA polymerase sigma factor [Sulfuriferula sp.]
MAQLAHPDDPLANLLSRCALKEQAAFEQLYKITSAKLMAVALRVLQRRDWAEDVLQESFVNIWHHAQDYQAQKAAPYTWMTHIVRNRALDWLRRPQHEVVMDEAEMENNWADPTASLFERLSQVREGAALEDCMRQIEAKNRQAIALAFWQGLSHSELAQHLRQPIGTVKAWVRRGLAVIKKCFEATYELS